MLRNQLTCLAAASWRCAKSWASYLATYGTHVYRPEVRRRLMIMNLVAYLVALASFAYVLQHFFVDYALWRPVILVNLAMGLVALTVPFLHRFGEIVAAVTLAVAELLGMLWIISHLGRTSGVQVQYVVFAAAPFVIFGLERLRLVLATTAIALLLHLIAWFAFPGDTEILRLGRESLDQIYISAVITTFGLVAGTVYYAFRLTERAQAETSALLANILPGTIVDRLTANPDRAIADGFDRASILFADLQGFVTLSKSLGPSRTVALLSDLMRRLDAVSDRHGIEKIKTIGDAYMAAAGVPEKRPDAALRLVRAAFDMLGEVRMAAEVADVRLAMRIGIATGPVMAGVIGARRLTYDVWGDTVNRAARLEGTSEPGRVHVCQETAVEIRHAFAVQARGAIELKGFGQEPTYFVAAVPEAVGRPPPNLTTGAETA